MIRAFIDWLFGDNAYCWHDWEQTAAVTKADVRHQVNCDNYRRYVPFDASGSDEVLTTKVCLHCGAVRDEIGSERQSITAIAEERHRRQELASEYLKRSRSQPMSQV